MLLHVCIVYTSAYDTRTVLVLCLLSCGSGTVYIIWIHSNRYVIEHVVYIRGAML